MAKELLALPSTELTVDIHCVTTWTKLGTRWKGVSFDQLMRAVGREPPAPYVMAFCDGGYTTNLPVADLRGDRAIVAYEYDGAPLTPEHGFPARLLVPHLYFWKSAKWVRGLRFIPVDRPGFWETTATTSTETPGESNGLTVTKVMDVDTAKLVPTLPRMPWREVAIVEVVTETERVRSLVLRVPNWPGHVAGQHVDVRLTAEDGYRAERSYSIASPPERAEVVLTIERVEDGEVSPYLVGEARPGDHFELRGPIGSTSPGVLRFQVRYSSWPAARASCRSWRCSGTALSIAIACPRASFSRHARWTRSSIAGSSRVSSSTTLASRLFTP